MKRPIPTERKAYTLPEAALVAGVSLTVIKDAADSGDLVKRYPTSRPVILASELDDWLKSRPTEKPRS